ncbi:MAG: enoyl-CoA hydratase [Alphaproteobacteria bacterium]|nr:enoyl-CoA hydratase [Alphaproteobacteria bacterium]
MTSMIDTVRAFAEGAAGRLRLNRPKALHALDLDMVLATTRALLEWRDDPNIRLILIDHAEGRGFCAGGDVVTIANSVATHDGVAEEFFLHEYRMNHLLFTYYKPTVVFMDGVTMGGGVGIAQPCRYRVATENTRFAMPETTIGFFPDVGGGRYLSQLPGCIGKFLALTGARLDGAECKYLGIATHYIPSASLEEVKARMIEHPERTEGILGQASITPPDAKIADNVARINKLFAPERLEDILEGLEADGSEWALKELAALKTKSPLSCKVSLRLLAQAYGMPSFAAEMTTEYALAVHMANHRDFREGVRALLIEKDNAPRWDPATPEEVTDEIVDRMFAPLPDGQKWAPLAE